MAIAPGLTSQFGWLAPVAARARVHPEQPKVSASGAAAVTMNRDIAFAPGQFRPESSEGRELIAHELVHSLQQDQANGGPAAGVGQLEREANDVARSSLRGEGPRPISKATSGAPQFRREQRRGGSGYSWFVDFEPNTAIAETGQEIAIELRNQEDRTIGMIHGGDGGPIIGALRDGEPFIRAQRVRNMYPFRKDYTFRSPGLYEFYYEGDHTVGAGPGAQFQDPVSVSAEILVVDAVNVDTLASDAGQARMRGEVTRWARDDGASTAERAANFERLALLLALEVLARNEREALDLRTTYLTSREGRERVAQLEPIVELLDRLSWRIGRLSGELNLRTLAHSRLRAQWERERDALVFLRSSLLETFPGAALLGNQNSYFYHGGVDHARARMQERLSEAVTNIRETRSNLLDGSLSPLDLPPVMAEASRIFGGTGERAAGRQRAIEHAVSSRTDAVATIGGAAGMLLFVPGIGPYLSAIAGAIAAGLAWRRVNLLTTAQGAGLEQGLATEADVTTAQFWAMFESVLLAASVAAPIHAAVQSARRLAPQVLSAAAAFIRRSEVLRGLTTGTQRLQWAEEALANTPYVNFGWDTEHGLHSFEQFTPHHPRWSDWPEQAAAPPGFPGVYRRVENGPGQIVMRPSPSRYFEGAPDRFPPREGWVQPNGGHAEVLVALPEYTTAWREGWPGPHPPMAFTLILQTDGRTLEVLFNSMSVNQELHNAEVLTQHMQQEVLEALRRAFPDYQIRPR